MDRFPDPATYSFSVYLRRQKRWLAIVAGFIGELLYIPGAISNGTYTGNALVNIILGGILWAMIVTPLLYLHYRYCKRKLVQQTALPQA